MSHQTNLVGGILFAILGIILFILSSQGVDADTITVAQDGSHDYTTIQEAIDNAVADDTINVYAGTYNESIVIDKTLTLVGKGTSDSIIQGPNFGSVVHITAPRVNLSRFGVIGGGDNAGDASIKVEGDHCNISSNECSFENRTGIHIKDSDHVRVENNMITSWKTIAILFDQSNNGEIIGNDCSNVDKAGIQLYLSDDNVITDNTCVFTNGGILLDTSHRNTISMNDCSNTAYSIYIQSSDHTAVSNNNFKDTDEGAIFLDNASQSTVSNNNCSSSNWYGIYLDASSDNTISENDCSDCRVGIYLLGSALNHLSGNTIQGNDDTGVRLEENSDDNAIEDNQIRNSVEYGIDLISSHRNSFTGNVIVGHDRGFMVDNCDDITIHENDILDNFHDGITVTTPGQDDVDATGNWWGSNTGPHHAVTNPLGEGNNVTDHVIYDPWVMKNPEENHKPQITDMDPGVGVKHSGPVSRIDIWAEDFEGNETIESAQITFFNATWNSTWTDLTDYQDPIMSRWFIYWDTEDLADGDYTVQVRAFDGTNYSRTADYEFVTVDNIEDEDDEGNDICSAAFLIMILIISTIVAVGFLAIIRGQNPG